MTEQGHPQSGSARKWLEGGRAETMALWVLLVLALGFGCGEHEPVIARVGRHAITESEFHRKLADVAPNYRNYVLTPNGRKQFLEVLVREKTILAAALHSEVPRSSAFREEMARLRAEERERLKEEREDLMTRLWLDHLRTRGVLAVADEEVEQYIQRHPKEVQISHILLAGAEEAEAVYRRLKKGSSFAAMARAKSLDAETAEVGGVMQPALFGEIIPELEDVVFKMKAGEVVGPVRSKFGYHILRKDKERRLTAALAEERVRRLLEKRKLDEHLKSLQSKYPAEILDAQFQ